MTVSRRRSTPKPAAPDSLEPLEIALDRGAGNPAFDRAARGLLEDQRRLVRAQIAGERMGLVLRVLTGLAGLAAAAVVVALVWQAARSQVLVVRPFVVPPEMSESGVTGEVAALRLLDDLAGMQAATVSNRVASSYADAWGDDVHVEIPSTGVSISELQAFLRNWLGREKRISGEIEQTAAGWRVTVRTGAEAGKRFEGGPDELDALIARAAAGVYESTQPERYATYLISRGRRDEAFAIYAREAVQGSRRERAWALAEWAEALPEPAVRLARAEQALELDPGQPVAALVRADALADLGRDEAALKALRESLRTLRSARARGLAPWWVALQTGETRARIAAFTGDHAGSARFNTAAGEPAPDQPPVACRRCSSYALLLASRDHALNHDPAEARLLADRGAAIAPEYTPYFQRYADLFNARAAGDRAAIVAILETLPADRMMQALYDDGMGAQWMPLARAEAGREPSAGAAPEDCYPCARAAAIAAANRGDHAASDRDFARAARLAPSLPQAHAEWARARLARGDAAGALLLLREARRRGPRWADPLRLEGDALAALGRWRDAVARYDAALELAPRWQAARQARAAAAARLTGASPG